MNDGIKELLNRNDRMFDLNARSLAKSVLQKQRSRVLATKRFVAFGCLIGFVIIGCWWSLKIDRQLNIAEQTHELDNSISPWLVEDRFVFDSELNARVAELKAELAALRKQQHQQERIILRESLISSTVSLEDFEFNSPLLEQ